MRVLFCPTSFVRTKLSNLETDLGRCLHFSYGPLRGKERYLIQTFLRPFHWADDHHPIFIMLVFLFLVWKSEVFLATSSWPPYCMSSIRESIPGDNTLQSLFIQRKWFSLSPRKFERNWPKKIWNVVDVANADHAHRFYMRWNTAVDQQTSSCKGWWDK